MIVMYVVLRYENSGINRTTLGDSLTNVYQLLSEPLIFGLEVAAPHLPADALGVFGALPRMYECLPTEAHSIITLRLRIILLHLIILKLFLPLLVGIKRFLNLDVGMVYWCVWLVIICTLNLLGWIVGINYVLAVLWTVLRLDARWLFYW
jgi:hypothetical protein